MIRSTPIPPGIFVRVNGCPSIICQFHRSTPTKVTDVSRNRNLPIMQKRIFTLMRFSDLRRIRRQITFDVFGRSYHKFFEIFYELFDLIFSSFAACFDARSLSNSLIILSNARKISLFLFKIMESLSFLSLEDNCFSIVSQVHISR
jgi:hypothetical protein